MFVSYASPCEPPITFSTDHAHAIAGLHAIVLLAPPLASTDVFSYQAYARMGATYGVNPYTHGPYAIALDACTPLSGPGGPTPRRAYGPVFTVFSYVLAPLSIATSVLAFKSIAALASLASVGVVWNARAVARHRPGQGGRRSSGSTPCSSSTGWVAATTTC